MTLHNHQHWQVTILRLSALVLTVLCASFKTIAEQAQAVDVGNVSELNGSAQVVRNEPFVAELDFQIRQDDQAVTSNGRMAITFLDDSIVRLTEHSKLTIDEYIFDPNPSKSKMAISFGLGTVRFVSGALNKIDKQNIKLSTPTANIAIRGTDFTCTVDELGRSLIILLPGLDGLSSGEIVVTTAAGSVVLNKPYEATTVSVFENEPSKPVILDLDLSQIDNMLIVTPPKQESFVSEESVRESSNNILDVDYLEFEDLDVDYLADDSLEFTELEINYLDVNFLEDLLDVLDALAVEKEEDQLSANINAVNITGTQFGQDTDTQVTTFLTGQTLTLMREVSESARVDIDSSSSYTVIFIQDGISRVIRVNGGSNGVIKITQSD